MFSSEILFAKSGSSFYNGVATQSVRFDDGSSPELTKTWGANETDSNHFTVSFWVKRCLITSGIHTMLQCDTSGGQATQITFQADDTMYIGLAHSGTGQRRMITNQVFRDTTSWYHILLAYDSENGTNSLKARLYVNGTEVTDFATDERSSIGGDEVHGIMDNGATNTIGFRDHSGTSKNFLDGYLCDFYCIDGQTLAPSDFTETKEDAVIPKAYSGSYGNNGFRLEFKQTGTGTASTTTIGADTSGNTNHFTSAGLVASDSNLPDSPENKFATLGGLEKLQDFTLSEGNLKYTTSTNQRGLIASTAIPNTGKHYFECRVLSLGASEDDVYIGVCEPDKMRSNLTGTRGGATVSGAGGYTYNFYNGYAVLDGTAQSADSIGYKRSMPQIIGVAVDRDNNNIKFTWDGSSYSSTYSIPANVPLYVYVGSGGGTSTAEGVFNFGADSTFLGAISAGGNADGNSNGDFSLAVPSGYLALCSANLPEPTIGPNADTQADDHFNTLLWSGNGSYPRALTGVGFQPDLVWMKVRNQSYGYGLFDSARGASSGALTSHHTNVEPYANTNFDLDSFDADGMTWASTADLSTSNNSGDTYVAWNWKAGGDIADVSGNFIKDGVAFTPTQGTIDATSISVNTTAKFSIVTYQADSSTDADTVAHALGTVPEFIMIKNRDNANGWAVYHVGTASDPETDKLRLDQNYATVDSADFWNDTAPTTNLFTVHNDPGVNYATSGNENFDYVAYCWTSVAGYSKCGSYIGNGSTDGTYIHLGFKPAFFMLKSSSATGNWMIYDNKRDPDNRVAQGLFPNLTSAESEQTGGFVDFVSNGVKCKEDGSAMNGSGVTYIYMAFAEAPFKYSTAR